MLTISRFRERRAARARYFEHADMAGSLLSDLFDYTDRARIRQLVKRYSDFITWPIRMAVEGTGPDSEPLSAVERFACASRTAATAGR